MKALLVLLIALTAFMAVTAVGLTIAAIWTEGSGPLSGRLAGTACVTFFVGAFLGVSAGIVADEVEKAERRKRKAR